MNALSSYIKQSKECFIRYPNTSKLVKKKKSSAARHCFNPLLSIWISDETFLHVFDINHLTYFLKDSGLINVHMNMISQDIEDCMRYRFFAHTWI